MLRVGISGRRVVQASLASLLVVALLAPAMVLAQVTPQPASPVCAALERVFADPEPIPAQRPLDWPTLSRVYRGHDYGPFWLGDHGPRSRAGQLLTVLRHAGEHGLDPADYHLQTLERLWPASSSIARARLDILLTDALIRYGRDLWTGRLDPAEAQPAWHVEREAFDPRAMLLLALSSTDLYGLLEDLAPRIAIYRRLQQALRRYRAIARTGGWPEIPEGPLLERGDQDPRVHAITERLLATGDLRHRGTEPCMYGAAVEQAVRRFQRRHGLEVDGIVGPETRAAMNMPVSQRLAQIQLNLDRWRWLPRDLDERYILVNAAGFRLHAVADGDPIVTMKVIVGKPYRETPAFSERMTHIVINPRWNVPDSIARKDLLPKQQADPDHFQQMGIRVLESWAPDAREFDPETINWDALSRSHFPYRLQQEPGPRNALGRLKFMLPNRFDIYLHDTPARHLFQRSRRTFSSGCIRLEEPLALAEFVLADEAWDLPDLRRLIASGETRTIHLSRALPVYLLYFTVWVDEDGMIRFARDVYHRDQASVSAFEESRGPSGSVR